MLWALLVLLLVCSGVVSASETALFGLTRQALHEFRRADKPLRRRVHTVMQHPHRVLMTVLIANTAINVSIFTVSFLVLRQIPPHLVLVTAIGGAMVPLVVIVCGEMLPKATALANPGRFAPGAAALIGALQMVLRSLLWVLGTLVIEPLTRLLAPTASSSDGVTTDELRLLVEQSAAQGAINSTENEMLQATVAMGEVSVREVMTPRVDIVSVRLDADRATVHETIRESGRRRIPVIGKDLDDIKGVLYARDVYLNPQAPVRSLVRRIHYVPEQVTLMQLLRHFRTERIHLAVVVDEHGGTAGLVTIEDVVEWIVGDLPDAETPLPDAITELVDDNTYRLSGDLSARVWSDRFGAGDVDRRVDTVGGVILAKLGRVPRVGDSVSIRNLTLTVESMRQRRIQKVLVRRDAGSVAPGESVA